LKSTSNGCKLFGYTQNELWGKHLDSLFLDIYTGNISNYIRQLINEWEYDKSKKVDSFYGKTKSHHCVSLNVQLIDPKKVINDKIHFLLLVWSDFNVIDLKHFKRSCHFIISSNLTIYNYSSQAIELLYLLYGKIPGENFLHALFPEICRDGGRDKILDSNTRITDTLLSDFLNDNTSKQELIIKSRANKNEIPNSYYVDQEFFKRSYICEFSVKVIETNMIDKDEANAVIAKKDESEFNNPNYLKEVYYSIKIDYQLNHNYIKKGFNTRNTLHETSHAMSLFKREMKDENTLLRETLPLKLDNSILKDGINESINATLADKRFNIGMIENKHLKMELTRVINELRERGDFNLTLMNYIKDLEKFKNLFKWYDEVELQNYNNNLYLNANKPVIQQTVKKDNTNKLLGNYRHAKTKKIDAELHTNNHENDNLIPVESSNINNPKLEMNSINNNLSNRNNYVAGSEREITEIMNNKKEADTGIKKNFVKEIKDNYDSDEEEDEEESGDNDEEYDSDSSNNPDYTSSGEKSRYEEAIDIIHSPENLDLAKLTKRLEALKDYSRNIEFCYFRESADRSSYPLTNQIIEVMKNVNLLHDTDGDPRRERNVEVTSSFSTTKKNNDANNDKTPPSLNKLRISSFLTLLIFLTYSIVDFSFNVNANNITVNNFVMIYYSYEALNEVTWASYLVRNLILTNNNNFKNYAGIKNVSSFITMNYDSLNTSYMNLMNIASNITNSNLDILPQHYKIIKTPVVPLYFENSAQSSKTNFFTLPDAIKSIYVKILTIMQQDPTQIIDNNIDVMNVQFNVYNDFLIYLQKSASYYTMVKDS
jgi:hypothetical protein